MKERKRGIFEKVLGSEIYWIRYVDATGRYRREKAGTLSAADKLLTKRRHAALVGRKLPETLRRRAVRFSELCDDAKEYIVANYAQPQHDLGRLENVRKWFGDRDAECITRKDVKAALNGARTESSKWSASSHNHHHTLISLIFRLAIDAEKVSVNPASGKGIRQRENNSRVRYLTPEEETKLREVIRTKPAWREHEPELDLALNTGLRRSSMYRELLWENVDLSERVATIPRTKNGDPVHIPLNAPAMKALMIFRSRGDGAGRVVRNPAGEPLNYPTHWFVPAVRAAGIKNFHWHDLRHHFASKLRQNGVPLGNIAELLGHKGLAMTKRYAHLSISNLHEAVAKIENPDSTPVAPESKSEAADVAYVQ